MASSSHRRAARDANAQAIKRILIVDNHADAADTLAVLLRAMGHQVHVARNASIALEISVQMLPQLVLLHLAMPEMSGYEMAKRMRVQLGDKVKLCALTGNGTQLHQQRSLEAGLDYHITKPVDPDTLRNLLA